MYVKFRLLMQNMPGIFEFTPVVFDRYITVDGINNVIKTKRDVLLSINADLSWESMVDQDSGPPKSTKIKRVAYL